MRVKKTLISSYIFLFLGMLIVSGCKNLSSETIQKDLKYINGLETRINKLEDSLEKFQDC